MDKAEFLKTLINEGYSATMVNGIPTVHVSASYKETVKSVKALKKSSGYQSSFSVKLDGLAQDVQSSVTSENFLEADGVPEPVADTAPDAPELSTKQPDQSGVTVDDMFGEQMWFDFTN